jgi:hypothetical protein
MGVTGGERWGRRREARKGEAIVRGERGRERGEKQRGAREESYKEKGW